jgi:hypothetical protein
MEHAAVRKLVRAAIVAVPIVILVAAEARFITRQAISETRFPRSVPDPEGRHDLAIFRYGTTVRASSVSWAGRHHPAYVVDGVPGGGERWIASDKDTAPWIEIAFDKPRAVDEVVLVQGGVPLRRFDVACFTGANRVDGVSLTGNTEGRSRHPLKCHGADRVRVTFFVKKGEAAQVHELEVWGT